MRTPVQAGHVCNDAGHISNIGKAPGGQQNRHRRPPVHAGHVCDDAGHVVDARDEAVASGRQLRAERAVAAAGHQQGRGAAGCVSHREMGLSKLSMMHTYGTTDFDPRVLNAERTFAPRIGTGLLMASGPCSIAHPE